MPGVKTNEREGTRAVLRDARFSASKARVVLDLVRGLEVARARDVLTFSERDAAISIGKLLDSAVANAENNDHLDPDELYVSACFADEGRTLKRGRARARGRYTRIRKRTCHITIIVSRLPEDRLARVKARQAADNANRRARRVAGGRPRRDQATEATAAEATEATAEEIEEAGIVDQQAAAVEAVAAADDAVVEGEAIATPETEAETAGDGTDEAAVIEAADQEGSQASGESTDEPAEGDREENE